jgi:hypothetical protein
MSDQPDKKTDAAACQRTSGGFLTCLLACGLIAYIAYLFFTERPLPGRRLWIPIVVETNGTETVLGETRQMEFWTPSAKTKDYLRKYSGNVDGREKWQILASDDPAIQFGLVLHSNQNVFGYRREEVWGQGRTSFKPGWWWTMNVTTNYSVTDLATIYRDFWKSSQPVMVEVIDNRGSSDK